MPGVFLKVRLIGWRSCLAAIVIVSGFSFSCRSPLDPFGPKTSHDDGLLEVSRQLQVPEGFEVELVYSVPLEEQGSWVALTPDTAGRLITADQFGSLYRVTLGDGDSVTEVEKLDLPIGHAQGLLYAYDSLYVTVNLYRTSKEKVAQGSGFYRVLDTDGDDRFDQVKLLKQLEAVDNANGHGEHGPHAAVLGPDGLIYLVAGNGTKVPEGLAPTSPFRNWANDLLIPPEPGFVPAGWVARTDETGSVWELVAGGFRNSYDLAFDPDGELFVFDADSEAGIGKPWYRPTRINPRWFRAGSMAGATTPGVGRLMGSGLSTIPTAWAAWSMSGSGRRPAWFLEPGLVSRAGISRRCSPVIGRRERSMLFT